MRSLLAWLALLVAATPALAAAPPSRTWLIVPGRSVGRIALGMEHADVLRLLGAPHREDDLEALADPEREGKAKDDLKGVLRDDWITPLPVGTSFSGGPLYMADFVTVYVRAARVVQIEVHAPRFRTKDGLSSASKAPAWRKSFPRFEMWLGRGVMATTGGYPAAKHFLAFEDSVQDGLGWRYGAIGGLAPDPDPDDVVEIVAIHAPGRRMLVDDDAGNRFMWKDRPARRSGDQ